MSDFIPSATGLNSCSPDDPEVMKHVPDEEPAGKLIPNIFQTPLADGWMLTLQHGCGFSFSTWTDMNGQWTYSSLEEIEEEKSIEWANGAENNIHIHTISPSNTIPKYYFSPEYLLEGLPGGEYVRSDTDFNSYRAKGVIFTAPTEHVEHDGFEPDFRPITNVVLEDSYFDEDMSFQEQRVWLCLLERSENAYLMDAKEATGLHNDLQSAYSQLKNVDFNDKKLEEEFDLKRKISNEMIDILDPYTVMQYVPVDVPKGEPISIQEM